MTKIGLALLLLLGIAAPAAAQDSQAAVQTTWRLLDYVAVDYREAVADGRIVNQLEYDEMLEFTSTVTERLAALPPHADQPALVAQARELEAAVQRRAAPGEIEAAARQLAERLLAAYPVPVAPRAVPDLARGAAVYAEQCAACHGADGSANAPMAAGMDPPPIDFTDRARARERSVFALYQVTSQGLEETAMQSFAHLPEEDRWAVALHAGRFAFPQSLAAEGERIWREDAAVRALVPDLEALVGLTPAALAAEIGEERAAPVTAFLRAHPEIVAQAAGSRTLDVARERLAESLAAYRAGREDEAAELALAAYLDGFEPVEALLNARDSALVVAVEQEMIGLRAAIGRGVPADEVAERVDRLRDLFDQADAQLAPEAGSAASTFAGSFAILLREGLEALLIVVALITLLIRAERRDLLRWVHAGWIAALVAGVATWWAASHIITISGADRELTEGFGALLAAVILLFVGIWMHDKSHAGAWQAYVKGKLDHALGRGSIWLLFGLSFIAVYREVFETIIFFAAIGAQGERGAMLGGAALAIFLLAIIAWIMLRLGKRLPIGQFFRYSSALIAVLAVVLAGKGVAALQEAGLFGVTPLAGFPRSDLLGIYPTVETLAAQIVMAALLVFGFLRSRRRAVVAAT